MKDEKWEPWLPKDLQHWEWARKALGVLKPPWVKVVLDNYLDLHDEKVLELLRLAPVREKDNPQNLLEDLLPEGWERLGEKASPEKILESMKVNAPSWQDLRKLVLRYLNKEVSWEELKDELGSSLDDDQKDLVSQSEFKKELEELTLREFLELST